MRWSHTAVTAFIRHTNGQTDCPKLKLVPFVRPFAASKRQGRRQKVRKIAVFLDRQAI